MKFGKTLAIAVASLGMVASGVSVLADGSPLPGTMMLSHNLPGGGSSSTPPLSAGATNGTSQPVGAAQLPVLIAAPVTNVNAVHQPPPLEAPPPALETQGQPPQRDPGDDEGFSRHDPDGGPGFKKGPFGCRCENLELFRPKQKAPEAFLFQVQVPGVGVGLLRFVNVRIAIGHRVKCTPTSSFQGCAASLVLDEENTDATWDGDVKDLHTLPLILTCGGKCDGQWHYGENYIVYTGMVTGDWPQTGKLHFRLVGKGCDLVQDVDINATVTFDSVPEGGTTGAVSGTVEVDYTFSGSHSGF